MSARLLPWLAFAAIVAALAVFAELPGGVSPGPAVGAAPGPSGGPEIRLSTVEVQEFHDDDGEGNRLTAEEASYEYARRTVTGSRVTVHLMEEALRGTTVRAPSASWDLERAALSFPGGSHLVREGGWSADVSPATLDLNAQKLRVPGFSTVSGPGITASGTNLVWEWRTGEISMDSPKGRIHPAAAPGRRG